MFSSRDVLGIGARHHVPSQSLCVCHLDRSVAEGRDLRGSIKWPCLWHPHRRKLLIHRAIGVFGRGNRGLHKCARRFLHCGLRPPVEMTKRADGFVVREGSVACLRSRPRLVRSWGGLFHVDDVADFVGFEAGLFEDVVEVATVGDLDEVEVGIGIVFGGQLHGADAEKALDQ